MEKVRIPLYGHACVPSCDENSLSHSSRISVPSWGKRISCGSDGHITSLALLYTVHLALCQKILPALWRWKPDNHHVARCPGWFGEVFRTDPPELAATVRDPLVMLLDPYLSFLTAFLSREQLFLVFPTPYLAYLSPWLSMKRMMPSSTSSFRSR